MWTEMERKIAEMIPKEYKWIAKDKNGDVFAYKKKPKKLYDFSSEWNVLSDYAVVCRSFLDLFPSLSWDDTEPTLIQDIIDGKAKPILDEVEKKYLRGVIRPWRDKVIGIKKKLSIIRCPKEFLVISLTDGDYANFPYFDKGSMYKGMEVGKSYTLEELGL